MRNEESRVPTMQAVVISSFVSQPDARLAIALNKKPDLHACWIHTCKGDFFSSLRESSAHGALEIMPGPWILFTKILLALLLTASCWRCEKSTQHLGERKLFARTLPVSISVKIGGDVWFFASDVVASFNLDWILVHPFYMRGNATSLLPKILICSQQWASKR